MAVTAVGLTGPIPTYADQVPTTQTQNQQTNVDWSLTRGAVALSTTRATPGASKSSATFLSTAVMISPTVGLTAAHSLQNILDAGVIDDMIARPTSRRIKIKTKAVHPDYRGNNFDGVDLAVFELESPLNLPKPFTPIALDLEVLKNEILQRIGFGERDKENRRTWVLENYRRRSTGNHYLTSEDRYGYPGDSGGPVYRTRSQVAELVGIHVGRMVNSQGRALDESNTLVLTPALIEWIQKTSASWKPAI